MKMKILKEKYSWKVPKIRLSNLNKNAQLDNQFTSAKTSSYNNK